MRRFIFIRHAESFANAGGVTMPNAEIPLSDEGRRQAQRLADMLDLKPSRVVVSSFLRARQTAQPFCERLSIEPIVHPLIHEVSVIDPALIDGMNLEQRRPVVDAYWREANPDKRAGTNAETFHEFSARVLAFQDEMDSLPDRTVIFGHGIWLALLLWSLSGKPMRGSEAMKDFREFQLGFHVPNCAIFKFDKDNTISKWHADSIYSSFS